MSEQLLTPHDTVGTPDTFLGRARYDEAMDCALAYHTGSPTEYLDYGQMQELATTIQAGVALALELDDQAAFPAVPAVLKKLEKQVEDGGQDSGELQSQLQILRSALAAAHKLVECNLHFARYRAEASMDLAGRSDLKSFMDIHRLYSPVGVLSDRLQAANYGLVRAAWNHKPGVNPQGDQDFKFQALAVKYIDGELYKWAIREESPTVRPSRKVHEAIQADSKHPYVLSHERRDEITTYDRLTHALPLHELT